MRAAKRQDELYGIGSVVPQALWEHVRRPFQIECPQNDNEDGGAYDWFRAWMREQERKAC